MENFLTAFADRLKSKLDDAEGRKLTITDQELWTLMDNHLDLISAAAAYCSLHLSNHSSAGQEVDML